MASDQGIQDNLFYPPLNPNSLDMSGINDIDDLSKRPLTNRGADQVESQLLNAVRMIVYEAIEEALSRSELLKLLNDTVPLIAVLVDDGDKKRIVESRLKEGLASWKPKCESFSRRPRSIVCTLDVYYKFVNAVKSAVPSGQYEDLLADLNSLAQKRAPCVFVRFASLLKLYPRVCDCSLEKATQLAHELGTDRHFVLVIGDPLGLEEELCKQVFQVCRMAGIEDEEIKRIIDRIMDKRKTSFPGSSHYANLEKSRIVSLLRSPTVAELQEVLSNNVSLKLHIIYAGHAYGDGSWIISDRERFRDSEICKCLESIRFSNGIYLILDCCFACKSLKGVENALLKLPYVRSSRFENPDAVVNILKKALDDQNRYPRDEQFIDNQRLFTIKVVKLYKSAFQSLFADRVQGRLIIIHIQLKDLNLSIPLYVYPLSASHLDPQGAMSELYDLKVKSDADRIFVKKIGHLFSSGPLKHSRGTEVLPPTDNPQLVCFPAGNGDSTLFRWHGFNMLIDGGRLKYPCFWPVVSRLPRTEWLDEVIVTHFDEDHILGILTMFKDPQVPITGRLHTTMPYKANPSGRSAKQGAELVKLAEDKKIYCRNLKASTNPVIHVHFSQKGNTYITDHKKCTQSPNLFKVDCLKVYMLTPAWAISPEVSYKCPTMRCKP